MKRTWAFAAAIGLMAVAGTMLVVTQNRATTAEDQPTDRPQDEAAIRAVAQSFAKAFEKGDANAFAALWSASGEYVDDTGTVIHGRPALKKAYGDFFAKRTKLTAESKTEKIRFLGKDTAIEDGTFTVKAEGAPANTNRYSALYVREDGKWLLGMLKEWGDDKTHRADISDLSWLIGTWESEGGDYAARTTYEWTNTKKFILSHYTITAKKAGEKGSSGTQVIGVDPATGLLHGWLFDAEGGIGESTWTWDGEKWVIDSEGSLGDGASTSATNFLTRSGNDAFTWRSVNRRADGVALPDLGTVKVKRVAGGK